MKNNKIFIAVAMILSILVFSIFGNKIWHPIYLKIIGEKTVQDVLDRYSNYVDAKLKPYFQKKNISYPPEKITLIVIKDTKIMEIWTKKNNKWILVITYPILKASGKIGPKLLEGDCQVPEGLYAIEELNPNSKFHLSMKINYPNEYDKEKGKKDGRQKLGGDIYIHGKEISTGCLAVGDKAIEELFVLAAKTGIENISIIIAPYDFRKEKIVKKPNTGYMPLWVDDLYRKIFVAMREYK